MAANDGRFARGTRAVGNLLGTLARAAQAGRLVARAERPAASGAVAWRLPWQDEGLAMGALVASMVFRRRARARLQRKRPPRLVRHDRGIAFTGVDRFGPGLRASGQARAEMASATRFRLRTARFG